MLAINPFAPPAAPAIPGLSFRGFRGPDDYPAMVAVIAASAEADHIERADTLEEVANRYAHLSNSDPSRDMLFAEMDGRVIGYERGWWWSQTDGPYLYGFVGFLEPAWRRRGIGRSMLRWQENRLREIAAAHPNDRPKYLQGFATQYETGLHALLRAEDYEPVRYVFEMVRPSLDDIPDYPLPDGFEVRPVRPEHYRLLWDAEVEAFHGNWGFVPPNEEDYQFWLEDKTVFQPELWQVAWDVASGDVAGQVRTFINHPENKKYERRRGYTEFISVQQPYRRRGLARALIARSLRAQRDQGMTESALGVDSQNESGALRVYEDCGFEVVKKSTIYRKPL